MTQDFFEPLVQTVSSYPVSTVNILFRERRLVCKKLDLGEGGGINRNESLIDHLWYLTY